MEEDSNLAGELTPLELRYHLTNFYAVMSKHRNKPWFPHMFYAMALMQPSEARQFTTDMRTNAVQMLEHLTRQNVPLDIDAVQKFNVAAPRGGSLEVVMTKLVKNPVLKKYGVSTVDLFKRKFLSIGLDVPKATAFIKAIILCSDYNNINALMLEEGDVLSLPWRVVNSRIFVDAMLGSSQCPSQFQDLLDDISLVHRTLVDFSIYDNFSLLIAVLLHVDKFDDKFVVWCDANSSPLPIAVPKLAPVYSSFDLEQAYDFFDLGGVIDKDVNSSHFDPWEQDKGLDAIHYKEIDLAVHNSMKNYDEVVADPHIDISADRFAHVIHAVDKHNQDNRTIRAIDHAWDERSAGISALSDIDPALAIVSSHVTNLAKAKITSFYLGSETSVFSDTIAASVPVVSFGLHVATNGHEAVRVTNIKDFANQVVAAKSSAILVVDNLKLTVNLELNKTWITTPENKLVVKKQIAFLRTVMRGYAEGFRFPIREAPSIIIWRTISPYDKESYNNFDQIITRLDQYYYIKYIPPSKPHEVQFTLYMYLRNEINTNKFIVEEGKKRRTASFVIRFLDLHRRYYGSIYRQMVFKHLLTVPASKVIRAMFLKFLTLNDFSVYEPGNVTCEFQIQSHDMSAEVKAIALEHTINYLGITSGKKGSKGERKARVDEMRVFADGMAAGADAYFSNFNN